MTTFQNGVVINILCLISRKTTSENEFYQVALEFENSLHISISWIMRQRPLIMNVWYKSQHKYHTRNMMERREFMQTHCKPKKSYNVISFVQTSEKGDNGTFRA